MVQSAQTPKIQTSQSSYLNQVGLSPQILKAQTLNLAKPILDETQYSIEEDAPWLCSLGQRTPEIAYFIGDIGGIDIVLNSAGVRIFGNRRIDVFMELFPYLREEAKSHERTSPLGLEVMLTPNRPNDNSYVDFDEENGIWVPAKSSSFYQNSYINVNSDYFYQE